MTRITIMTRITTMADGEEPLAWLHLMRLCSPLLPVGAFAYSQGLEQAVHWGLVKDAEGLRVWLGGLLSHSLAQTDLAILRRAHRAWLAGDVDQAKRLTQTLLALRESAELRAEDRHMGSALARLLRQQGVPAAESLTHPDQTSYVVTFALAATHFGITETGAVHGFCFAWLENQVSAALRCMSLGQAAAQKVLSALLEVIPKAAAHSEHVSDTEIGFSSAGLAIAAAAHETLYSRLFRS